MPGRERRLVIEAPLVIALAALALGALPARAESAGGGAPLLTVEEALDVAQRQNHLLSATARQVSEADERAAALRTRRLPALRLDAFAGRSSSIDSTIPAGSLGTVPQLGPLPPTDSTLSFPAENSAAGAVSASQPITQQYKIGLGIDAALLERRLAEEEVRHERQRLVAEVRTAYYKISATEAGIVAQRDLVRAVEELDALTARYLTEGVALRSDALEMKARLARERQRLAAAERGLSTQREHLNQLMGRDVSEPFRVVEPSDLTPRAAGLPLEAARERARSARPEIRTATLRAEQADTARRIANAGWIPDLSLTAAYARFENMRFMPDEAATVGLTLTWEPFDWGRKRHEAAEREHQIERARDGRAEAQEQIEVEVGLRWRAVQDAAALLEATRLDNEACAASLAKDRNRFQEDATMLHEVLQSEARLAGARHDFTDALAGYWSAAAELERTIGNEN